MPTADDVRWFKQQFSGQIQPALAGAPFDIDMLVAIACQETGEIWPILRKKSLSLDRIAALCVGDTIDFPRRSRSAFPKNRDDLVAAPNGEAMFEVARNALEDMAQFIPGYASSVANPNKFCHGFGVFQRDIQFFKDDPGYFLDRRYEKFSESLAQALIELHNGLKTVGLQNRTRLTDFEFASVAIAYNTGGFNSAKGLKQGFFDGEKFYGERIAEFLDLSRSVQAAAQQLAAGRYTVIARGGLKLRAGPGTNFDSQKTLPVGTDLNVVDTASSDPAWVRVDLEGDGLVDGYVFASFLAPAGQPMGLGEGAPEPG